MNAWGNILAAAALGIALTALVIVLTALRRPMRVEVAIRRPRGPRHSNREPARIAERRAVVDVDEHQAVDDDDPEPWPPPAPDDDAFPGYGPPYRADAFAAYGPPYRPEPAPGTTTIEGVNGGFFVHTTPGAATPDPLPAPVPAAAAAAALVDPGPEPGHPYPWYGQLPEGVRGHVWRPEPAAEPAADGTWTPRSGADAALARPYVDEPGQGPA